MLDKATVKQISEFVYAKPRTVQEISLLLKVNWRTADRYVDAIAKDEGTISCRTFREGTRGALKIVFWNNIERLAESEVQEHLLKQIESGRKKGDFSPSEIIHNIDKNKIKIIKLKEHEYNSYRNFKNFADELKEATQQILFFSGNMTWSNYPVHDQKILDILESLARKKISSKVLTRVELAGINNIKNILAVNNKVGYDAIEVRHRYQPLRCTIVDDKVAVLKEVLEPENYAPKELKEKAYLLYYIYDKEWIEWLQRVFWHLYRPAVSAKRRLDVMKPVFHTS